MCASKEIKIQYKNGDVSGMHSWLRFYLLERNASQQFDYRGYTIKRFVSFVVPLILMIDGGGIFDSVKRS